MSDERTTFALTELSVHELCSIIGNLRNGITVAEKERNSLRSIVSELEEQLDALESRTGARVAELEAQIEAMVAHKNARDIEVMSDESRKAFEVWAVSCNHSIDKDNLPGSVGHTFHYTYTEYAWQGWCARDAEMRAQIAAHERVCAGTWVPGFEWIPHDGWHVTAGMKMQHSGPSKMDHDRDYYSAEWNVWRTYNAAPPDFVLQVKLPTSSGEK